MVSTAHTAVQKMTASRGPEEKVLEMYLLQPFQLGEQASELV